jgi:hypothetical protein
VFTRAAVRRCDRRTRHRWRRLTQAGRSVPLTVRARCDGVRATRPRPGAGLPFDGAAYVGRQRCRAARASGAGPSAASAASARAADAASSAAAARAGMTGAAAVVDRLAPTSRSHGRHGDHCRKETAHLSSANRRRLSRCSMTGSSAWP